MSGLEQTTEADTSRVGSPMNVDQPQLPGTTGLLMDEFIDELVGRTEGFRRPIPESFPPPPSDPSVMPMLSAFFKEDQQEGGRLTLKLLEAPELECPQGPPDAAWTMSPAQMASTLANMAQQVRIREGNLEEACLSSNITDPNWLSPTLIGEPCVRRHEINPC